MDFQDEPKREFKGIFIPAEIWLDKSLSANEKVLYAEIDSFSSNDKACYISNEYIANLLGISETNASKALNSLIKKGYVVVEKFDGRRRYIRAKQKSNDKADLSISTMQDYQKRQDTNTITIKEEENKKDLSFLSKKDDSDFFASLVSLGISEDVALEWMKLRKKHKATNSSRSFSLVKRAIEEVTKRLNITPTNVIEICLARGWYGCQTSYFEKIKLSDFGIASALQPSLQLQANRYEMIDEQGNRYYLQGYGKHKVIIPTDAPPRPSETMFWSNFTKSWYQP